MNTDIYKTDLFDIYFDNSNIIHNIVDSGGYYHQPLYGYNVPKLKAIVKSIGIKGGYKLNKAQLTNSITNKARTMLKNLNSIHHEFEKRKINRSRCTYCTLTGAEYKNYSICHNCYYGEKLYQIICDYCTEKRTHEVSGQSCGYGMPHTDKVCEKHIPTEKRGKINSYNDVDVIIRPVKGNWRLLFSGKVRNDKLVEQEKMDEYSTRSD